jgi:hypothetical protein
MANGRNKTTNRSRGVRKTTYTPSPTRTANPGRAGVTYPAPTAYWTGPVRTRPMYTPSPTRTANPGRAGVTYPAPTAYRTGPVRTRPMYTPAAPRVLPTNYQPGDVYRRQRQEAAARQIMAAGGNVLDVLGLKALYAQPQLGPRTRPLYRLVRLANGQIVRVRM